MTNGPLPERKTDRLLAADPVVAGTAEVCLVDELKTYECLARAGDSGNESQMQAAACAGLLGDVGEVGEGLRDAGAVGAADVREWLVVEDAPGRGDERG